jgi:hypothetical protein
MRDGNLKIKYEAGKIKVVSVSAGLDLAYRRLFEAAKAELRKTNTSIEAGISLIIFGCFWLEAVCSETLKVLLQASMNPPSVADVTWDTIKRASFHAKFSLASAFARKPDPQRAKRLSADIVPVFDLRNRLAHFKDEDIPVTGPLTAEEFKAQFDQFPDADLIEKLRPPSTNIYAEAIEAGISWLNEIHSEYFPSQSIDFKEPAKDAPK